MSKRLQVATLAFLCLALGQLALGLALRQAEAQQSGLSVRVHVQAR